MQAIHLFRREELETMSQDELIQKYLALKESFLEHLARETEQDRLIRNLTERQNRDNAKHFGRFTETSASLSGPEMEKDTEDAIPAEQAEKNSACENAEPEKKERFRRKPGCAQRIKEGFPVKDIHVRLSDEKLKELLGNYQWRELPDQSYDILRYRRACLYIERCHIHIHTAGGKGHPCRKIR